MKCGRSCFRLQMSHLLHQHPPASASCVCIQQTAPVFPSLLCEGVWWHNISSNPHLSCPIPPFHPSQLSYSHWKPDSTRKIQKTQNKQWFKFQTYNIFNWCLLMQLCKSLLYLVFLWGLCFLMYTFWCKTFRLTKISRCVFLFLLVCERAHKLPWLFHWCVPQTHLQDLFYGWPWPWCMTWGEQERGHLMFDVLSLSDALELTD